MVATSAFVVPLIRSTAAPSPGAATVLDWTLESYCSKTGWREDRFGRAEEREEHGARVLAAERQHVDGLLRGAGRRGCPAARRGA